MTLSQVRKPFDLFSNMFEKDIQLYLGNGEKKDEAAQIFGLDSFSIHSRFKRPMIHLFQ